MTFNETVEFLEAVAVKKKKASMSILRLAETRERATAIKSMMSTDVLVMVSPSNRLEQAIVDIDEAEDRVNACMIDADRHEKKLIDAIYRLDDPRYIEVLFRRYINCEHYDYISEAMGYDTHWVIRLRKKAIEALSKVI